MRERLIQYGRLCRLDRPIGIYLLLWPTLWALWIAGEGHPNFKLLLIFVAGVVLMRSAGCAINDYADRNIDPHVERTRDRPLAAGRIRAAEAIGVFLILLALAFGLVLLTNPLTVQLSFIAAALAAAYPFAKRHTYLPQVVLGAAFGWSVPMAFAAQSGTVPIVGWLLFIATVLWTTAYDTMYAMVDRDDDIKIGIKSTAILFGEADVAITMLLQGMMLFALLLVGQRLHMSAVYYCSLAVAMGLVVYQYFLLRHRQRDDCFKAFLSNHYLGMVIFIGLVLHYLYDFLDKSF
ncbi:MAG TPA: 4-hydroxybenzoate octaprenyltransferase [Gammaproteobacteria bacterium]|nr:4-hydroxybenzoate octaprenyltransferase [Gammaproteobacteria bacterium]